MTETSVLLNTSLIIDWPVMSKITLVKICQHIFVDVDFGFIKFNLYNVKNS
jgi:hypothetical protein